MDLGQEPFNVSFDCHVYMQVNIHSQTKRRRFAVREYFGHIES